MEITVHTSDSYRIKVERGLIDRVGECASEIYKPCKVLIVTDSHVSPLYVQRVADSLREYGYEPGGFTFPAGEPSKQLETIQNIYLCLAEHGYTRSDFIVALGGGVTGDMAGFAAATYLRGIGYIQVPTSLLAQIDSSVGGKTAVDLPQGKNLVGAFWQPRMVLIDPNTLDTLSPYYFADGMAEAIKYGCIMSRSLFDMIKSGDMQKPENLDSMICQCIDIKRKLVEKDEFDTCERMLLNFGHTFGHALEKLYGFNKLSHGQAVGIGMVLVTHASEKAGATKKGTAKEIEKVLKKYTLPVNDEMPIEKIVEATAMDKKGSGKNIKLVLLGEIGKASLFEMERTDLLDFAKGSLE